MAQENSYKRQMSWAHYVDVAHPFCDDHTWTLANKKACDIMRRARSNVQILVERLSNVGYQFAHPEHVYVPPIEETSDRLLDIEGDGVFIPLSLKAWIAEVGTVNLTGSHPDWERTGYLFDYKTPTDTIWYTDALVVETNPTLIVSDYENWQWQSKEDGIEEVGPFRIEIAPDDVTKANVSGGGPYRIDTAQRAVDAILLNERHCVSFVAYLRIAFAWGGFPGFEFIDDAPNDFLQYLCEGLEPI